MLRDRLLTIAVLAPLGLYVILSGGPLYLAVVLGLFTLAAWEYTNLFRLTHQPARPLILTGVGLLLFSHPPFLAAYQGLFFGLLLLAALLWHSLAYERGVMTAGLDFSLTLTGIFYLGWLGGYWPALRWQPDGQWWATLTFTTVALADVGAYVCGRVWGRHKLAPRLSPNKTWQGYLGGVITSTVCGGLMSLVIHQLGASPEIFTWPRGAGLGLLVGLFSPLGDLGISMLKRQTGVKDTGHLLPGHGGILDRIDSWLVAMVIGYYFSLLCGS